MMKKSGLVRPEFPMNGLEDQPSIPLIELASMGQLSAVKEMLLENYDVNETGDWGNTAAMEAASRNDLVMLKLLVEYGAQLDLKDGRGRDVMDRAMRNKNQEMIDYINSVKKEPENTNNFCMML